jgi:hypothetical protein
VETVKWGSITYLLNGKASSWMIAYEDHLDLGFFTGARLRSKRLEGTGKNLRRVEVFKVDDIDEHEFRRLLKDVAKMVE